MNENVKLKCKLLERNGSQVSVPMSLVRRHLFEGAKRPQTFRPITIPNSELGKLDLRKLSERTRKYRK